MEGEGSNSDAMIYQSNETSQVPTEVLDPETEDWMEECRSILNSDAPIRFQDLLAEGGILSPPRDVHPEFNQNSVHIDQVDSRGKNLIILDDESDDDNGPDQGILSDSKRQLRKRKLPNSTSPRMLVGESSRAPEQGGIGSSQENVNMSTLMGNQVNVIDLEQEGVGVRVAGGPPLIHQPMNTAGNGTGVGEGTVPQIHQNPNCPVGQAAEFPQRNTRRGRTGNPRHGFVPAYSPISGRNPPSQPAQYNPVGYAPMHSTGNVPVSSPLHSSGMSVPYRPAYHNMDPQSFYHQGNWNTNNHSNNNPPPPGMQIGSAPNMPTNMNYQMFPGNMVSTPPRNPVAPHAYGPSIVPWNYQVNFTDQFAQAQRISEAANHHPDQWRHPSQWPPHTGASARAREIETAARSASHWPELTMVSLRQAGVPPDVALSLLTAAERTRLLNEVILEIRNALRLLRGNFDALQFEEVMIIERAQFNALVEENDQHGDMRLDVDGMSYEDLLALEQNIGNVSTGLAENVIQARLRRRKYRTAAFGSPSENAPCCICQDEYAEGDDTAKLRCGHYFHFNCIKQWLVEKNNCPICKNSAIDV